MNKLKATNISCNEAYDLDALPDKTVLISINEEDQGLYPLRIDRNDDRVITFKFSDLAQRKEHNNGKIYLPMLPSQALQMLQFIEKNKDQNFIVHCAAGVSRSGAICLYLHHIYGHELKPRFWQLSNPNKYILGSLLFHKYEERKVDNEMLAQPTSSAV